MRKIIVREMLTVDGFFCGPNGEIDWHVVDAEFNDASIAFLDTVDTLMFGRVTQELMASYWPTPAGMKDDPAIAERMNSLKKVYFSKGAGTIPWNNSTLLHEIVADDIAKMKQAPGKDIAIFGSGTIVDQLTQLGLIDEYWSIVNPVILGKGKTLFPTLDGRRKLKLLQSKTYASGNVLEAYEPVRD